MTIPTALPRTRTKGSYSAGTWRYRSYNGAGEASGTDNYPNGEVEVMKDVVQRGFHARSLRGEVLMNPLDHTLRQKSVSVTSHASVHAASNPAVYYWYEGYPRTRETHNLAFSNDIVPAAGSFILSMDDIERAQTEASTKVLSNIGRASTDSWENLYEVEKTLGMIWSPLGSWFRFHRKMTLKGQAAAAGASAANLWLMYRYGIRPLVQSIDDILTASQRLLRKERVTTRAKVKISAGKTFTANWTYTPVVFTHTYVDDETVEVRAMSLDEVVYDWRYTYGFDAKSLLTLPWNAIPYSFVVDWFANVADFIGAVGQAFDSSSLGQCMTTTRTATRAINSVSTSWGPSWVQDAPWDVDVHEFLWTKTRRKGLPRPGLVIKSDFRLDSVTRLADAVALVGQQLLRRFGPKVSSFKPGDEPSIKW